MFLVCIYKYMAIIRRMTCKSQCTCLCVYIYMYIHMYIYIYLYIYLHIHTYIHKHTYTYACVCISVHIGALESYYRKGDLRQQVFAATWPRRPSSPLRVRALIHTATHCNTLQLMQHTSRHCNILQHTATHRNTLPHTATHCNTLQHTATRCNARQHAATHCNSVYGNWAAPSVVNFFSTYTLQHTAKN